MKAEQKQQAKELYLTSRKTLVQIAVEVGVDVRTLYRWARCEAWDKMKQAALSAPALIVQNMFTQLLKLQTRIANRELNDQVPTFQEAEITRKLVACITNMNKYLAQGMDMKIKNDFMGYLEDTDNFDIAMRLMYTGDNFFVDPKASKPFPWQELPQQVNENQDKLVEEVAEQDNFGCIAEQDILIELPIKTLSSTAFQPETPECHQPDIFGHSDEEIDIEVLNYIAKNESQEMYFDCVRNPHKFKNYTVPTSLLRTGT